MRSKYLKEGELIPLYFDMIFKKIFGDLSDIKPLHTLIKVITGIDAKEITILNSEILGESLSVRRTTVDLIAKLEDGTKIGIEMNSSASDTVMLRNFTYITRIMANDIKHNEEYDKLSDFIQINFDMDGKHKNPIDLYMMVNVDDPNYVLVDKLKIYRVNIPYFVKKCYNQDIEKLEYKDRFIGLIGTRSIELMSNIAKGDKIMSDIKKKIESCNSDKDVLLEYDYRKHHNEIARLKYQDKYQKKYEKKYKGKVKRLEKEIEERFEKEIEERFEKEKQEIVRESAKQNTIQIAKNFLDSNTDINIIAAATGLSIEEIQSINKN